MATLTIIPVDMDEVRAMLARRELYARMRELLPADEIAIGSLLTNKIDRIDANALSVQTVLNARLAAYRDGLQTMETCA